MNSVLSDIEISDKKRVHPKWFLIKAIWLCLGLMVLFKWGFGVIGANYTFAYDGQDVRCIEEYKAYLVKKNQPVVKGKIYALYSKGLSEYVKDGTWLGKYIVAEYGDKVELNKNGIFVNGKLKTTGFALAKKLGKKEESFYKTFTVPKDKFFAMGTSERSYDSRYWGLVDIDQIIGRAIPLW